MSDPIPVKEILQKNHKYVINDKNDNVTNDNKNTESGDNNDSTVNNVIIDNIGSKYALDREKFIPNTPESQLAEEIATELEDLQNYAAYYKAVKEIGVSEAIRLKKVVMNDIERKKNTSTPVRDPKKYFMWVYKKKHY